MKLVHSPNEPAPLAKELRAVLMRRAARLARTAERVREGNDSEAVHDLRVAIRRLESALDVWRDALAGKPLRRVVKTIRNLRRTAGATREPEALASVVRNDLRLAPAELREPLEALRCELGVQQAQEQAKLRSRVAPWRLERVIRRMRRALRPLATLQAEHEVQRRARVRVELRRRKALAALLEAQPGTPDEALHDARLRVKRWRYSEEALAAVNQAQVPGDQSMQWVQEALGQIQDLATLRDWATKCLTRSASGGETPRTAALTWLIRRSESERLAAVARFHSYALPDGDATTP